MDPNFKLANELPDLPLGPPNHIAMEFFIPFTSSVDREREIYLGIKNFINHLGYHPLENQIYTLKYFHEGKLRFAMVGEKFSGNEEPVLVIFETETKYLICTQGRCTDKQPPLLVDKAEMTAVTYFDK